MTVKYGKFELPSKIKVDESARRPHFCRFIAEPFERGFGHTVGNVLRRILLTSMEAPAIISIRIEGVPHEYMAIEGIIEDMTHIVLNFKSALLRKLPTEEENVSREPRVISKTLDITGAMLDKSGGHYVVTSERSLSVIQTLISSILTIRSSLSLNRCFKKVDVKIGFGRGYVPSERHVMKDKVVDEIIVDTAFSPVRLVNYYVENTRVGQDTDFDRLILEVTTDGRISPEEALSFATQIGIFHLQVFEQLKKHAITFDTDEIESNTDRDTLLSKLALKINEIELSVRSTNCLSGANIETIGELVIMPESEMLKFRNFGKKSLNEIKAKLEEMGLSLGMDLSRFGITRDNVKQLIIDYLAEKGASKEV